MSSKNKARSRKFKEVKIKLSARQYASLKNCAAGKQLTINKFVRQQLESYLTGHEENVSIKPITSPNQLTIFQLLEPENPY